MRDLDEELVEAALQGGFVDEAALQGGFVDEADLDRVDAIVERSGGKLYRAQVLVRERFLTTDELLTLQNRVGATLYTCRACGARHKRADLPTERGQGAVCKSCKEPVRLKETAALSRIEILASQDPRDLSIPLENSSSASASVSEIDLDRYEVQDELGRGGYGVVFRATHRDLEREVALKVLRKGTKLPEIALERFLREGRSASRLRHPNIVSVYDIGRYRDLFAMTMEYVAGRPLKNVLREKRRFPPAEAAELMCQVLEGVQHAHEQGVIHRDLKPTNIIIDEEGRPRLIDFGLAKDLEADTQLTGAGAIIGTPYYLSPEQIQGRSHQVDARSDVFALGVILYEILSGKRPFTSNVRSEIYVQILKKSPKPIGVRVEGLPEGLAEVIDVALAKKAEDRYQSAEEFRQALLPFLDAPPAAPASGRRTKPGSDEERELESNEAGSRGGSSETRRKRRRRRTAATVPTPPSGPSPAILAAAGGGLLLLVILGLVLFKGGDPEVATATPTPTPEATATPRRSPSPQRATPTPEASSAPAPAVSPEPIPVPEPTPSPEPSPEASRTPSPSPSPAETPSVAVAPSPTPAATPTPTPAKVALDTGAGDAAEFPLLAKRGDPRHWLERAFFLNQLVEDRATARQVRGLRFALSDPRGLNRAFAIRGLLRHRPHLLRFAGSQGLFERLLDLLADEIPYTNAGATVLLGRIAGDAVERDVAEWRAWFENAGQALLREALRAGPQDPAQGPSGGGAGNPGGEALATKTREDQIRRFTSRLRKNGAEVMFVIDVTISMTDELQRIHDQVSEIVSFMQLLFNEEGRKTSKKVRLGFVTYGDTVVLHLPLTNRLDHFARAVSEIKIFDDKSDKTIEEGISKGLEAALSRKTGWKRGNRRVKAIVLLGDAPPLDPQRCRELAEAAHEKGSIVLNALIAPPKYAHKPAEPIFTELAKLGGGTAAKVENPEELITQILTASFGGQQEADIRRFVSAHREVTGRAKK